MKKEMVALSLAIIVFVSIWAVAGVHATTDGAKTARSPVREGPSGPLLDPKTIPKYVNQLTGPPPVFVPVKGNEYCVTATSFEQQILPPPLPMTHVWGYGGLARDAVTGTLLGFVRNAPAPTFEATRNVSISVNWANDLTESHMFAVDPTLHWANPNNMSMPMPPFQSFPPGYPQAQSPVPLVTHVHGLEVSSTSDGNPDAWWTVNGKHGPAYNTEQPTTPNAAVFYYPNTQPAATLLYHDHALGMTRLNVMSGLAGFYLLRDPADPIAPLLPSGSYEVPLAIQDRNFYANGSFYFPSEGENPAIHPYWKPESFGNTIMVNGKVWPNMNVDRGVYRFRLVDGSNARFYTLSFSNGMSFTMIGGEGGYLRAPVPMTQLTMAPGERADILVDFSNFAPGTKLILQNVANEPFPDGDPADPLTTGQIMQFTVTDKLGHAPATLPATLNPTFASSFPSLPTPTKTRVLTLTEVWGPDGPLEVLLDGQRWSAPLSEQPQLGTTEDWIIINLTPDTHPIHWHLVDPQLVSRQALNVTAYAKDWKAKNGEPPLNHSTIVVDPTAYLTSRPVGPPLHEQGWKDTIEANPGEVTTVRIHFAPMDGSRNYPFNATAGPGYVWHCHIIDHEDNEMMRPFRVASPGSAISITDVQRVPGYPAYLQWTITNTGPGDAWVAPTGKLYTQSSKVPGYTLGGTVFAGWWRDGSLHNATRYAGLGWGSIKEGNTTIFYSPRISVPIYQWVVSNASVYSVQTGTFSTVGPVITAIKSPM
jgi:FtsP/CotA-like multicopper oxidase with cupredoxin domain